MKNKHRWIKSLISFVMVFTMIPLPTSTVLANETVNVNVLNNPIIDVFLAKGISQLNTTNFKTDILAGLQRDGYSTDNIEINEIQSAEVNISSAFNWNTSYMNYNTMSGGSTGNGIGNISITNNGSSINMVGNQSLAGKNAIFTIPEVDYQQEFTYSYSINYGDSFNAAGMLLRVKQNTNDIEGYMLSFNNTARYGFGGISTNGALWKFKFVKGTNFASFQSSDLTLVKPLSINQSGTLTVTADKNSITISGGGMASPVTTAIESGTGAGFGFFSDHYSHGCSDIGSFVLYGITLTQTNVKSLTDVLKAPAWRDNSTKMLVNVNDYSESDFQNANDLSQTLMRTINEKIHYISWGNSSNQESNTSFIAQNNGNGMFVNNSNYTNAINQTVAYIESVIDSYQSKQYVVVEEPISLQVFPSNLQTNTATTEYPNGRWKVVHEYTYFKNNMGKYINSDSYQKNLVTSLDKVGKYRIYFADKLVKDVYVHRMPIAGFSTIINGTNITYQTHSVDMDSDTNIGFGKGIVQEEWKYRESTATTWTNGKLTTFNPSKVYLIQMRVKDEQGQWSNPVTKYLSNTVTKPVADFNYGSNTITKYDTLNIVDSSYDPSGKAITQRTWVLKKNGTTVSTTSTPVTNFNTGSLGIGTYSYTLTVKNSANVVSEEFTRTFYVEDDTTKPEVIVDVENSDWKTSQTVNAVFSDHGSGFDGYKYIMSTSPTMPALTSGAWSAKVNSTTATFTFNTTGEHYLHLVGYDIAGNYITKTSGAYKIDVTAPTINATTPNATHVQSFNVTMNVSDNVSVASYKYIVNTSSVAPSEGAAGWITGNGTSATVTLNSTGNYYLHVIAYDHLGNRKAQTFGAYRIDTSAPTVIVTPQNSTWKQSQTVTFTFSDGESGVDGYKYIIDENSTTPSINDSRWSAKVVSGTGSVTLNTTEDTGKEYLHLIGYDKVGNYVLKTTGIYHIDTVKPEVSVDVTSSYWKKTQEVNISFTDTHSEFSYYRFIINQNPITPSQSELNQGQMVMASTGKHTFNTDGLSYLHVIGYDKVGNYVIKTFGAYQIDNATPTINATPQNSTWKQSQQVVIDIDDNTVIDHFKYVVNTNPTAPSEGAAGWTTGSGKSATITHNSTGIYYVHVIAYDVAGNRNAKTFGGYEIDTTKPKVVLITPEQSDWQHSQEVEVTFSDEHSGFDYYKYIISKNPNKPELNDTAWSEPVRSNTGTITINTSGLNYLYLVGYDKAGNYIESKSGQYKIYMAKPEIIVDVEEAGWTKSQTVNALFSEYGSEYNGYKYVVNQSSKTPSVGSGLWSETSSNPTATFIFDKTGNYYLHLMRIDSQGDYIFKTSGAYDIDTQNPVIGATTPKEKYVPMQTVQIVVGDSVSGIDNFKYAVTKNANAPEEESSQWMYGVNDSATIKLDDDGIYYVHVIAYDKAGNRTARTFGEYKIDGTKPEIMVDPKQSSWAMSQRVNVTLNENGSGIEKYEYVINQSPDMPPTTSGAWTTKTGETTAVFTIEKLGENYLHMKVYDKAGNVESKTYGAYQIDTIKPVITVTQPNVNHVKSQNITMTITDNQTLEGMQYKYAVNTSPTAPNNESSEWTTGSGATATTTLNKTGNYYLHVVVTDTAGNKEAKTFGQYKIDVTAPSVVIEDVSEKWEQRKKVSVTFEDTESGFSHYKYVMNTTSQFPALNSSEWSTDVESTTGTFVFEEGGTYYLHIMGYDKVGNYVTKTSNPYRVDTTAPTVTVDPEQSGWAKTQTINVSFQDKESEFSHYRYIVNGDYRMPSLTDKAWSDEVHSPTGAITISEDGTHYLHLVGYDKAGNYLIETFGAYQIDTVAPTVNATTPLEGWKQKQVVAINVTDDKTLTDFRYVFTTSDIAPDGDSNEWKSSNGLAKIETLDVTGIYYLHVIGNDVAGNEVRQTIGEYMIDSTKPVIDSYTTDYLNDMVELTIEAQDEHSGIAYYGVTSELNKTENITWQESNIIKIQSLGTHYIYVKDNVGNISAVDSLATVEVEKFTQPEILANPENSSWKTKQEVEITFNTESEIEVDYYKYLISTDSKMPSLTDKAWSEPVENKTKTITLEGNTGEYYIHFIGYDKKNNTVIKTYGVYQIDNTAPVVTGIDVEYKDDNAYLTIKAKDEGSGIVQYGYRHHSLADKPENITWQNANVIRVANLGKYSVYAKDKVGHVSVINPESKDEKGIIEIKAFHQPKINVSPRRSSWVKQLELEITFTDEYKDADYYQYIITESSRMPNITAKGWSSKITREKQSVLLKETGEYYIHIIGYDKKNNTIKTTFGVYEVDNLIPEILNVNSTVTNNKVTLSVETSDRGSGVKEYALATRGTSTNNLKWQTSNKFEDVQNGTYSVYVRDYAGNMSRAINTTVNHKEVVVENKEVVISFNTNGGTQLNSVSVVKGSKINAPQTPVKNGYVFDGWYTNSSLTTKYNFNNAINANMTLYAKWKVENKPTTKPPVQPPVEPETPEEPIEPEFSIKDQYFQIAFVDVNGNTVIEGEFKYAAPIFVVDEKGNVLKEYNARQSGIIQLPTPAKKTGYKFDEWNSFDDDGVFMIQATYEKNKPVVTKPVEEPKDKSMISKEQLIDYGVYGLMTVLGGLVGYLIITLIQKKKENKTNIEDETIDKFQN